jgi:hypothetical protein
MALLLAFPLLFGMSDAASESTWIELGSAGRAALSRVYLVTYTQRS